MNAQVRHRAVSSPLCYLRTQRLKAQAEGLKHLRVMLREVWWLLSLSRCLWQNRDRKDMLLSGMEGLRQPSDALEHCVCKTWQLTYVIKSKYWGWRDGEVHAQLVQRIWLWLSARTSHGSTIIYNSSYGSSEASGHIGCPHSCTLRHRQIIKITKINLKNYPKSKNLTKEIHLDKYFKVIIYQ